MANKPQNVEEKAAARGKLREAQHVVLQLIGHFVKPSEIAKALTEQGLVDVVTKAWIEKVSSERCRPKWTRPLVDKYRQQFITDLSRIPCRHRAYRLMRLQHLIETTADDKIRIQAINAAHEMSGDRIEKFEDVGLAVWRDVVEALERADEGGKHDG